MEAAHVLPPGSILTTIVYKHSEMPYYRKTSRQGTILGLAKFRVERSVAKEKSAIIPSMGVGRGGAGGLRSCMHACMHPCHVLAQKPH